MRRWRIRVAANVIGLAAVAGFLLPGGEAEAQIPITIVYQVGETIPNFKQETPTIQGSVLVSGSSPNITITFASNGSSASYDDGTIYACPIAICSISRNGLVSGNAITANILGDFDVMLDSFSRRPHPPQQPDRNVPEGNEGDDEGFFTFTINTNVIPDGAPRLRVAYTLAIDGGINSLPADALRITPSGNGDFLSSEPPQNAFDFPVVAFFLDISSDFLTGTFTVSTAFDGDRADKTLTFSITYLEVELSSEFVRFTENVNFRDADGNGNGRTASLTLWDPGTAKIAADNPTIAENEATTFTVTLAGLRTPDSEGRDVDHWPVRVNFPQDVVFTKNDRTLESNRYNIEISGNIPTAAISVPGDARNAIEVDVAAAAIAAEADEEAGKEVIIYTFRPKRGAHLNTPSVAVTLARPLAGETSAEMPTNNIYVPNDARRLTFSITESTASLPSVINAISIDHDDGDPGDASTSTIAESGTVVVTVVLDNPLPAEGTISYRILAGSASGDGDPIAAHDMDGNVGDAEDAVNVAEVGVQADTTYTFTVNVADDNRIEPDMEHGRIWITEVAWGDGEGISGSFTPADAAAAFMIDDNDRIELSIADAIVRDSAGRLAYTVNAVARPQPASTNRVILDRDVTALLSTANGDAPNGAIANDDYTPLTPETGIVTFSTATEGQSELRAGDVSISITPDSGDEEETFILSISSGDPAVILPDRDTATVTIAPTVTVAYDSAADIALDEEASPGSGGESSSTERVLILSHPSAATATVSFAVSGADGEILKPVEGEGVNVVLELVVGDGATELEINTDRRGGSFTIPPRSTRVSLMFTAVSDTDRDSESITFTINSILFDDTSAETDVTTSIGFDINVNDVTRAPNPTALTATSIDHVDNNDADASTSTIAESGTIVVTVALNNPFPQGGEIKYRILPGSGFSVEDHDMEGNVGSGSENTAAPPGGATVRFFVNVTDDNRIEPNMEQGTIEIFRLDLPGNTQVLITANNTADFTIRDNDKISLSAPDARVSENTDSFDYTVTATAAPVPVNAAGVVLDREVTATLNSADDTAIAGNPNDANDDYTAVTDVAVVFPINAATQTRLINIPSIPITVADDGDTDAERFILSLDSDDPAAILPARATAAITIAPDPVSAFAGAATVTLAEGGASRTRALTVSGAPGGGSAIVSFGVSGGTVSTSDDSNHDFHLDATGVSGLAVSGGGTTVTFTIPADSFTGGSATVTLAFTSIIDTDTMPERVTFVVTGIEFPGNSDYDVNEGLPALTIILSEPTATLTRPDGEASENGGETGRFTVTLTDRPAEDAVIAFRRSGNANFSSNESVDYNLSAFLAGRRGIGDIIRLGSNDLGIPSFTMPAGVDAVDLIVNPVRRDYDEPPETVILTLELATFTGGAAVRIVQPAEASRTITITDHRDDVSDATLDKSADPDEAGPVDGTFTLKLIHAPEEDAMVTYALAAGEGFGILGENYTASISGASGGVAALTTLTGTFTIPRDNIRGTTAGAQGGARAAAEAVITITPVNDDNLVSENVKLTINSITFGASGHGNLLAADICPTGSATCPGDPGSQTLRIADDDITADYDSTATITLTEGAGISTTRVILLANIPGTEATATFTLTDGFTTGAANPDVFITVGGGASMLSFTDAGDGGTFRIPAGDSEVTITFTPADDDGDAIPERITFAIPLIDFENSDNDPTGLSDLTINVIERLPVVTAIFIGDGGDAGDAFTIAESEEIVVTVVLDTPLPAAGTISYRILADNASGDGNPIAADDVGGRNVGEDAVNAADVGVQAETTYTFTVDVTDDNRIEQGMEHGRIRITEIAWNDRAGISGSITPAIASTLPFTIADNDRVELSILDASVRDSEGRLIYTVAAAARPQPTEHAGVILDRDVTALLSTDADSDALNPAAAGSDYTSFTDSVVTFSMTDTEQSDLSSGDVIIVINSVNSEDEEEETFILRLGSGDPAVILPDRDTATVTIIPAVTAAYDSTAVITLTEEARPGSGGANSSTERVLILSRPPAAEATVSFTVTGVLGEILKPAGEQGRDFALELAVGDGAADLQINNDRRSGSFTIPSGNTSVSVTFTAVSDDDEDSESIMFTVTNIEFDDTGAGTDVGMLSALSINIEDVTDVDAPTRLTGISIDHDDGDPNDASTSTIAESGTIVVTVALDNPFPEGGRIQYRILPGDNFPIEGRDMDGNVGGGSENTATLPGGTTVSFSVNIADDNRVEQAMEHGSIEIFRLDLPGGAQVDITADNTAAFTIEDNDRVTLSAPDATVSENTGTFGYTVAATAVPTPANAAGVVLDRDVTAILNSDDGSATIAAGDYTTVTDTVVVFSANTVAQADLMSSPAVVITVENDGDTAAERFSLTLTSSDAAVDITDNTAIITIAPDPSAVFAGGDTVPFREGVTFPEERTLAINGAPGGSSAVVSFRISDGTVSIPDDPNHDFRLDVESAPGVITDVSDPTVSENNTIATFTIPADNFTNGSAMVTLEFTPITDTDAMPERITFSVAGIRFPGNSDYDVNEGLPALTITITEAVAALTRPDGTASENGETGHFTVTLDNQLARTATIVAELSGGANFAGTEDADYDIAVFSTDDRGNAIASTVTGTGSTRTLSFSMSSSANPVDVVVSARVDNYDEPPEEITLRLVSAAFTVSGVAVEQLSDPASRTITITDHDDDVSDATLDKSSDPREAGPVNGTFTLELLHAPDEDAEVAYTFAAGAGFGVLGENYTASVAGVGGGTAALTAAAGAFTIPRANITGSGDGAEGGNPGEASATITITPVDDNNFVNENVKLTINSITFGDNASTHGDLAAIDICPTGSTTCPGDPGSQTLQIMDDESATAAYDTTATITLTEGAGISTTRVILLANVPGTEATATFTLADGFTTGAANPDVLITVGGGASMLSFTDDGNGGTFRIPAGDSSVTITFTPVADDGDAIPERIIFAIPLIDFENSDNDISGLPDLIINVIERLPVVTAISIDHDDGDPGDASTSTIAESGTIVVTVVLDHPLSVAGTISYRILAGNASGGGDPIAAHDVVGRNVGEDAVNAAVVGVQEETTYTFTVDVTDDNRIEPNMEQGAIEIFRLDLPGGEVLIENTNRVPFTIEDNDRIRLSAVPDMGVRVDATGPGRVAVAVAAVAEPSPTTDAGVILDRSVTALLSTADADADAEAGVDYTALTDQTGAVDFLSGLIGPALTAAAVDINIIANTDTAAKSFNVHFSSDDPAVILPSDNTATVTIVPAVTAEYDVTGDIALTEEESFGSGGGDATAVRVLTLFHPPAVAATVSFTVSSETDNEILERPQRTDSPLRLTVGGGATNLVLGESIGRFTISVDDDAPRAAPGVLLRSSVSLTFTAISDTDRDSENIMFTVNDIEFADAGEETDVNDLPVLNINITDANLIPALETITNLFVDDDEIPESGAIVVTVVLDNPLPAAGTISYRILAGSASGLDGPIAAHDVDDGIDNTVEVSVSAETTHTFTVNVTDDNRIEPDVEHGLIEITEVAWNDGADVSGSFEPAAAATAAFTITDNDGITLRLDAGEYRVRDNAGTLTVTVNAVPAPIPSTHTGIILDRAVAAILVSRRGGTAIFNQDYALDGENNLNYTINETPRTEIPSQTISVTIRDDNEQSVENFSLVLAESDGDRAVNLGTPHEAVVTIVPNTTGRYIDPGVVIGITEAGVMSSVVRTLSLSHAPASVATVSFELTGGTVAAQNVADRHALALAVGGGATDLTIGADNSSGSFIVPSGDNEVTLRFEAADDFYGDDETIIFSITGIAFADEGDDTDTPDNALPPNLTINITDAGATAVVTGDTAISELTPDVPAVILVSLSNIPSSATNAVIGFSLAGATLDTDYTVTLAGSSTSVNSVTIDEDDIDGDDPDVPQGGAPGRAEATLTFHALDDLAGIESESIELTIESVAFAGASGSDLPSAGNIAVQIITITDRPVDPLAVFRVGEASVTEGGVLGNTPNFNITFSNINTDTGMGMVNYEFSEGFSADASTGPPAECGDGEGTYCAFFRIASGGLTALTSRMGSFEFPVSSVSGGDPIGIFILPREDADAEDETVELEITSITVPQSGEDLTFSVNNGNLVDSATVPTNTARITITDNTPVGVAIVPDNAGIAEGGRIAVTATLNKRLPQGGTIRYTVLSRTGSGSGIAANDVAGGFNPASVAVLAGRTTASFTVSAVDDNRIEQPMEEGVIEVSRIEQPGLAPVAITADNTADFTIEDNDRISLSIADQTVSENIGTFEYTVTAVPASPNEAGVVLDRAVTATLNSDDGSATIDDDDYGRIGNIPVIFPASAAMQTNLTSDPVPIDITNDGDAAAEEFTLILTSSDDAVAEIADEDSTAAITIAPDPSVVFAGGATVALAEESRAPMTRTLTVNGAPGGDAIVSLGVSGGTVSTSDNASHDFILGVASASGVTDVADLTVLQGNTTATFTIPADNFIDGTAATVTLTFTPIIDADIESENIAFGVAGIQFPDDPTYNVGAQSPDLTITIAELVPSVVADVSIDDDVDPGDPSTSAIAESGEVVVTVVLDNPLPAAGTISYRILAGSASGGDDPIAAHDVDDGTGNIVEVSVSAETTHTFTVNVTDDNRIEPDVEHGRIEITRVAWDNDADVSGSFVPAAAATAAFTITDNDGITLTLDAGEYRVRDNAGTLTVTVNAAPNPTPETFNAVILDRTVTANFFTGDGVGVGAATVSGGDYDRVVSDSESAQALSFTGNLNSVAYDIGIENDDDSADETFTVNLGSDDTAVNIGTPDSATVTIVPNTTGRYIDPGVVIGITEAGVMSSVVRTLSLGHAPESVSTVSFSLRGGTAAAENAADRHALALTVGGGAADLTIGDDNSSGSFIVLSGNNEVTLRFEAADDFYGDDETIIFSITGIAFADDGDDTDTPDDALPPDLTINITDAGAAAAVTARATDGDIGISELNLNDETVILVSLTDIPSSATNAVIGFSLAGEATRTTDYTVTLAGSSTSASSVTITKDDIDGYVQGVPQGGAPGRAEATLTFRALNDLAGLENETIELTIDSVAFEGATASDLAGADDIEGSSQTITITDRPVDPLAVFSVVEEDVAEGDVLGNTPNFRITLFNIGFDTGTGMVAYEFSDGFGATASTDPAGCADNGETTYCAFIRIASGDLTGLTTQTGSFTFPVSSVNGEQPIDIFILPRKDADAEDETVELEITSIIVPQSGEDLTFSLGNRNLMNFSNVLTSTAGITITDDAPAGIAGIMLDTSIAEGGEIAVTVTLDQRLPQGGTIHYMVLSRTGSGNDIEANDVAGGFASTSVAVLAGRTTASFTVGVVDDNRIEPPVEEGVIEFSMLDLPGAAPVAITADNTADFTIEDNDKIRLSVADQTVSENTGTFEYTVTAVPTPPNAAGVVLDRAVTAVLNSTGGSAIANIDYTPVTAAAVVFLANMAVQANLTSTPVFITVVNNAGTAAEDFGLMLTSNDDAVEIADNASTITIAPDPSAVFAGGDATVALTEGRSSMTRTLTVSRAPGSIAVVSFGVGGGTVSISEDTSHNFILGVASAPDVTDVTDLTVLSGNTTATFTIPADNFTGGTAIMTLTFTPITDADTMSEEITFAVASIRFPGNSDYDVNEGLPALTITITEAVATLTRPDGTASENGETGHFTVTLDNQLARTATIVAELSGGANFAGTEDADYDITVFSAGDRDAIASTVTGTGSTRTLSFFMASNANPVDVVVSARADNYDELPEEITLRLVSAAFTVSGVAVEQPPDPASRTITITDHDDDVSDATLDKSGSLNEDGPVSGTFTLKLLHAPDEDAAVTYAFAEGAGFGILGVQNGGNIVPANANYTAAITGAGDTAALTAAAGAFTIPRANITGSDGGMEGDNPGEASATITITPVDDNNFVNEDVKLTINSITFGDNASTHGDLAAIDICPTGSATCPGDPGSQTLQIMDDESATAAYDTTATITLTEGTGISTTRVILLANVPGTEATATFTLADGFTTGAANPDVLITVGGGADTLSFTDDGTGGTFRIPAGDPSVTITFTLVADGDDETIAFTITGIDFENSENDIGSLIALTIITNEPDAGAVQLRVRVFLEGALQ